MRRKDGIIQIRRGKKHEKLEEVLLMENVMGSLSNALEGLAGSLI